MDNQEQEKRQSQKIVNEMLSKLNESYNKTSGIYLIGPILIIWELLFCTFFYFIEISTVGTVSATPVAIIIFVTETPITGGINFVFYFKIKNMEKIQESFKKNDKSKKKLKLLEKFGGVHGKMISKGLQLLKNLDSLLNSEIKTLIVVAVEGFPLIEILPTNSLFAGYQMYKCYNLRKNIKNEKKKLLKIKKKIKGDSYNSIIENRLKSGEKINSLMPMTQTQKENQNEGNVINLQERRKQRSLAEQVTEKQYSKNLEKQNAKKYPKKMRMSPLKVGNPEDYYEKEAKRKRA